MTQRKRDCPAAGIFDNDKRVHGVSNHPKQGPFQALVTAHVSGLTEAVEHTYALSLTLLLEAKNRLAVDTACRDQIQSIKMFDDAPGRCVINIGPRRSVAAAILPAGQ